MFSETMFPWLRFCDSPRPSPRAGAPSVLTAPAPQRLGTWSPGRAAPVRPAARQWRWCGGASCACTVADWAGAGPSGTGSPCSGRRPSDVAQETSAPSRCCRSLQNTTKHRMRTCQNTHTHLKLVHTVKEFREFFLFSRVNFKGTQKALNTLYNYFEFDDSPCKDTSKVIQHIWSVYVCGLRACKVYIGHANKGQPSTKIL